MSFESAYQNQLISTSEQLEVLRDYNQRCWQGHFSQEELAALDVSYERPSPDNVAVIHAEFGSSWDTFNAWRRVYMSHQITHWNTMPDSRRSFEGAVRQHQQTAQYEPGLHIVHMDLTQDHDTYRTMNDVYAAAEETPGMLLAHAEGLALVGLHRALRDSADSYARAKTPYLPGYQARNVFVPEARAGDYDWTVRFDHGHLDEGWGLRVFPTKGDPGIGGAVLLVHGTQADRLAAT